MDEKPLCKAPDGETVRLNDGLCAKCSGVADPPYKTFIGGPALCEKCACEEYKQTAGYLIDKSGLLARDVVVKNPSA